MSDMVLQKNLGALIDAKALSAALSWTAGGSADNAAFTGLTIDREGFSTGSLPRSADIDVAFSATLAAGKTLSLAMTLNSSPDGSNWTAYATQAAAVVATGPTGGATVEGVARMVVASADNPSNTPGVNLGSAQRYLQLVVTPPLSATGTDTAPMIGVGVVGGFDQLAAPAN